MVRVFVVDDHAPMRALVRSLTAELGYEVVGEAANGRRAVAGVADTRPDLVVMDWKMPIMDGLEATTTIRAVQPDVDVIAFTSTDDPDLRDRFLAAGACAHVAKGDVPGLIAALERCGAARRRVERP